jgi:ABC-2 type transport system permease protein
VLGWHEFIAMNPPRVLAYAIFPRAALQMVFFALLGQLIAGAAQRDFNVVGAMAYALTSLTVVSVSDVPVHDKESDVFWRIRTGTVNPVLVLLVRAWPYPVAGVACVLFLIVLTPVVGAGGLGLDLLPLLPCFVVMAGTSTGIGMAGAALALGRRADVLVGNLVAYLLLLCSGALLTTGRIGWVDRLGSVLPLRHGISAVRAGLAGQPYGGELRTEAAVGAAWFAVAAVTITVLVRRASSEGYDHFS